MAFPPASLDQDICISYTDSGMVILETLILDPAFLSDTNEKIQ